MLTSLSTEDLIPADHPIRKIRRVVDEVLGELDGEFDAMYSRIGRPSIPPEQLLKATVLMPSYGRVTSEGVPVDPDSYDYRRAALDAIHFSKLVDRFWPNLRRCAGYRVQYFAAVEGQRRGAPHLHAAARGAFPRQVIRDVRAATYHQVWWPAHDEVVYGLDRLPQWSAAAGYVDPASGAALPTWDEASTSSTPSPTPNRPTSCASGNRTTSRG